MDVPGNMIQKSLKTLKFLFNLSGVPFKNSAKTKIWLRLLFLWNITCVDTDVLGTMVFCYEGFNVVDFVSISFLAPCMFYSLLANFKAICLIIYEKEIDELIDKLIIMEDKVKTYNFERVYLSTRDSLHKVMNIFTVVNAACLGTFMSSPLLMMALSYFQGSFEIIYSYSITYPFDPYRIELFPIVYLHQGWTTALVLAFVSTSDFFFYTCCSYISCHFKLLQRQFETLISERRIGYRKVTFDDIKTEFEELVQWHQQLISLANMLETIYAKSSLYNFVSSSALICLSLFNVTTIKDIAYVVTFFVFLTLTLVQIYFLCYFGDKITQSSMEVSNAVYKSLWYIGDAAVGKHLLLVLMRSQKPCKLTALGFADINQRAFMKILSNAWSYFALLKTMYP